MKIIILRGDREVVKYTRAVINQFLVVLRPGLIALAKGNGDLDFFLLMIQK